MAEYIYAPATQALVSGNFLLNVMRNFDQSNTLPEFDLELFIHCGVELAR
jgi:hypothetical protein